MGKLLQTLTEQDSEDVRQAKEIMLKVLAPLFPDIKPSNLEVTERIFELDFDAILSAAQTSALDYLSAADVETRIAFKDFALDWEKAQILHESLNEYTGIWHSYNAKFICHHAAAKTLTPLMDTNEIVKLINQKLLEKKRTAALEQTSSSSPQSPIPQP